MTLRLRLVRGGMRLVVKPVFRHLRNVALARWGLVLASLAFPLPFGMSARRDVLAGVGCLWLRPGLAAGGPVLLWLHGGAYVTGSAFTHRGMVGRIARQAGCAALLADYRLAPEHPAPAALHDAIAVFDALVAQGIAPRRIVLGGDSAGGGLAAALLAHLQARGGSPAGIVLLSPWADLTQSGASIRANAARDPLLPVESMDHVIAMVRGALAVDDPRISPAFADFAADCPALISVGSTEILLDDALTLAARLRRSGAQVDLARLPGAPHVLAFLAPWVPEAAAEIRRIARFVAATAAAPGHNPPAPPVSR